MARNGDYPSLSRIEGLILQMLLVRGEMYGLQLVNESDGLLKRGTVYVTLQRMEDKNFIKSRRPRRPPAQKGLARPLYRATCEGKRTLQRWESAAAKWRAQGGLA